MRDVDASEAIGIQGDVVAHLEAELREHDGPVGLEALDAALELLGRPDEWPSAEAGEAAEKTAPAPRPLAEVVAFALFFAGLALVPVGYGLLVVLASYVVARAALAGRGGPTRWQRLALAPLVFVSAVLQAVVLIGPGVLLFTAVSDLEHTRALAARGVGWALAFTVAVAGTGLGAWWIALGLAARRRTDLVRSLAFPFQRTFDAVRARRLACAGLVCAVLSPALALLTP